MYNAKSFLVKYIKTIQNAKNQNQTYDIKANKLFIF